MEILGIILGFGVVLPTIWVAWEIGRGTELENWSLQEFFLKMGAQRNIAYLSAWGLIVSAVLLATQLLPN